jgi:hypothetical protein
LTYAFVNNVKLSMLYFFWAVCKKMQHRLQIYGFYFFTARKFQEKIQYNKENTEEYLLESAKSCTFVDVSS